MIFYFTATGNSKFIAERIAHITGEQIIDIAQCVHNARFIFDNDKDEPIGVVTPVYFRGIPMIVAEFLRKLNAHLNPDTYTYVVLSCGGGASGAERYITPLFKAKAVYDVALLTNYVPLYQMGDRAYVEQRLDNAEQQIDNIIKLIQARESGTFKHCAGHFPRLTSSLVYPLYKYGRKTNKFTVNKDCTSCATCVKGCPRQIIKLENGKPTWTAPRCETCFACLHRCPAAAINYGKKTAAHGRYVNPRVQL